MKVFDPGRDWWLEQARVSGHRNVRTDPLTEEEQLLEDVYLAAVKFLHVCPGKCSDVTGGPGSSSREDCVCWSLRKTVRDLGGHRFTLAETTKK